MLRWLLLINIGVFLGVLLTGLFGQRVGLMLTGYLSLHPAPADVLLHPWQLLTYGVLHTTQEGLVFGLLHLTFNLLWLVWIGEEFEQLVGGARLGWVYLWSTLGGGAVTVALHAAFPGSPAFAGPVYGATAPVIGVAAAVVQVFPHKRIGLLFVGVIPLRAALLGFLALSMLFGLSGGTFFAAHVGGAVAGMMAARLLVGHRAAGGSSRRGEGSGGAGSGGVLASLDQWLGERAQRPARRERSEPRVETKSEVDQRDVDRILDKISEQGYEALTQEERRTLFEASKR